MKNYSGYSEEELFDQLKNGDGEAIDYLMEKYSPLVKREARKLFLAGADEDDLIQEGMIGLFKAVCGYEKNHDTEFSTFATLCIRRQLYTTITASNRKKHGPLNHYVSFWEESEDGMPLALDEVIGADDSQENPESVLLRKEQMETYYQVMERELSDFEKEVVTYYLDGESYTEIARHMDRSSKSIDNAIQRIRKKLSNQS